MIAALRAAVGSKAKVMIDANGGWMYHQALYVLQRAVKYDVYLCEQPVPWWDIDGLARLRRKVDVPIFADESAAELGHLLQIIEKDAADGFFLKVPKAGGILKSRRWVSVAQAANMPVMCGCMINSGLGSAAEAAFLGATAWMGRIEQESIGPLNLYNIYDTVERPHRERSGQEGPRATRGATCIRRTEWGWASNWTRTSVEKLATPGKPPVIIELIAPGRGA